MCQNQQAILAKINDQIVFVLQLANGVKDELLLNRRSKRLDSSVLNQLEKITTYLSRIPYFCDQEIDNCQSQNSWKVDFDKRTLFQIIGIGQYYENIRYCKLEQNCYQISSNNEKFSQNQKLNFVRGPYRSYRPDQKIRVIRLYQQGRTYAYISRCLGIPQKNVVRWCRNGILRKIGAGRKIGDADMEEDVLKWIQQSFQEGEYIKAKDIRDKATEYSTKEQFKSSKGWLKNFIRRHALNKKYDIV